MRFQSTLVAKFINCLLKGGKKSTAERHIYRAVEILEQRFNAEGLKIFMKAIENVKPYLEVRSRRVGGSTYQVPVEVRSERRTTLALRWLIMYSNARNEKTFAEKLAGELGEAYNMRGAAIKKRDDTHKMAEANKAFAHYRW